MCHSFWHIKINARSGIRTHIYTNHQTIVMANRCRAGVADLSKPGALSWILIKAKGYQFYAHWRNPQFSQLICDNILLLIICMPIKSEDFFRDSLATHSFAIQIAPKIYFIRGWLFQSVGFARFTISLHQDKLKAVAILEIFFCWLILRRGRRAAHMVLAGDLAASVTGLVTPGVEHGLMVNALSRFSLADDGTNFTIWTSIISAIISVTIVYGFMKAACPLRW